MTAAMNTTRSATPVMITESVASRAPAIIPAEFEAKFADCACSEVGCRDSVYRVATSVPDGDVCRLLVVDARMRVVVGSGNKTSIWANGLEIVID